MWVDSWSDLFRVLAVGAAAYVTVVVVLRVSGKRTLAKLNAFDLVVTVALGSTLATILLNGSISWAEGAAGLAVLAFLQSVVAWLSVRMPWLRNVVTARPAMVFRDGLPVPTAMKRERISLDEIRQAVRATGAGDLASVACVVLESDGSLSVITTEQFGNGSALEGVAHHDADVPRGRP